MPPLHAAMQRLREAWERLASEDPDLFDAEPNLAQAMSERIEIEEANVRALIARLIRASRYAEALANGAKKHADDIRERARRLEARRARLRELAFGAMQVAGMPNIEAPDFTAGLRAVRPSPIITDAAAVPDDLCRITREPNLTAIREALVSGATVPGAVMGNGGVTLDVRGARA